MTSISTNPSILRTVGKGSSNLKFEKAKPLESTLQLRETVSFSNQIADENGGASTSVVALAGRAHEPGILGTPLGRGEDHKKAWSFGQVVDKDGNPNLKLEVVEEHGQSTLHISNGDSKEDGSGLFISFADTTGIDTSLLGNENLGSENLAAVSFGRIGDNGWIVAGGQRFEIQQGVMTKGTNEVPFR